MVNACWAVYYHTISTDDAPQHDHCPKGVTSWCKYQKALALNTSPPPHKDPLDKCRLIPLRLKEHVKPIFDRLCKRSLLERCVLGATQNQNESFNKVVWQRCSKTDFSSAYVVETAVNLAVLTFNSGAKSISSMMSEHLKIKPGPLCLRFLKKRDVFRVKRAEKKTNYHCQKEKAVRAQA